jgi:hypothetical protein
VSGLLERLSGIDLKADPNQKETPSPRMKGWTEEPTDEGLGMIATWQNGAKKVQLKYLIVQPPTEGAPAFYLATREIAVGEFVDLLSVQTKPEAKAVFEALPKWARETSIDKPWDKPLSWRPRTDRPGVEVNPNWIYKPTAPVLGLLDNTELRARTPVLDQAVSENPTPRTPVQMVPPVAAKIFAEEVLGARLPKLEEWGTITSLFGKPTGGFFRGSSFQRLWKFLEDYREGGQVVSWRPNEGAFPIMESVPGSAARRKRADDGQAVDSADQGRLWLAPVDEGPTINGFINLFGNVWIYLYDGKDPAKPAYYVAGGSIFSPPGVDVTEPRKVEASGLIGATRISNEGFTDVGIRPAFDAPPGFRERYKLYRLVQDQKYLAL